MLLFFRKIITGIKNLFLWFPVIWNDRQWDYYFFFILLRKKLVLMEKHFRTKAISESAYKDADNMKQCIKLLNRLINESYHNAVFESHDKKWGELDIKFSDSNEDKMGKIEFIRPNVTEENSEQERKEFRECLLIEDTLRNKDINNLFKTIKNEILKWWD
jgi:hypothetical protein